ncbi:MAG: insulinase family protein [Candidatus Cloacimonetes bacterium]|nr:insulinase family protein [Candidatus Cloacimonadota bacterium]
MPEFPLRPAVSGFLPNGLKYILHADDSNPVLCLQLYLRVGSAWEDPREAGYAHLLEHLAFKSTRHFGYNQITQFVNSLGGSINAYTDFDCTCYYLLLPSEYLDEGLLVLSELAIHPSFSRADLAMEKDIVIEEMEQNKNDPESDFFDYIQTSALQQNPLSRPVMGTKSSVRGARLEGMRAFHRKYYQPANAFLVAVGNLSRADAVQRLSGHFGAWRSPEAPPTPYDGRHDEPQTPQVREFWRKHRQEYLAYVLPELCDAHPDSDSLLIAMRYLAIGRSSRLFKRLVEQEKLASSVKVSSYSGVMSGISAIVVSPMHPSHVHKIQSIFRQEYQALLSGAIEADELSLVKKDVINSWRYGFDGVENLAEMIGAEEFVSGYELLYSYDQQIQPLGPEDVLAAVRKHWQPANLQTIHQSLKQTDLTLTVPLPKQARQKPFRADPETGSPDHIAGSQLRLRHHSSDLFTATLPNGLKIILRHQPRRPVSGFALATDVCQLTESSQQRGLNYLCSAAMLHSTGSRSYAELLRTSREHGISLNVEHQTDTTVFRGKCFHAALPTALTMLSEIFRQPAFEPSHIRLLKGSSIDQLRRDRQNPSSVAFFRWFRLLFGPNSIYGRYSGTITELASHSRAAIRLWHHTCYRPNRFSLAVVSSEQPQQVLDLIASLFSGHSETPPGPEVVPPTPQPSRTRFRTQKLDTGQALIHLGGFAAPARDRVDTTAFHILAQILGGEMDSRLFNLIREKYGFAYQTGLEYSSTQHMGYWFAYACCDPDDRKPCLRLMREIIADVCANGVTATELLHAQNYLCGMNRFEVESAALQAMLLASLSALGYAPDFYLDREQRIRSIDLATINRVANHWLQPSNHWGHILT